MEDKINHNEIIKAFNNQVAGHKHALLKPGSSTASTVGIVKFGEDCILKPITKARQGHTEISFYQQVWSSSDSIIGILKLFVPKYYGTNTLELNGQDVTFLRLQDLTVGLKKPCIADIKIGAITWEPNADFEKQFIESSKYADTKEAYGLSLTGYQVFNLKSGQLIRRDKNFGKSIKRDTIQTALKEFFNFPCQGSHIVLRNVLRRLKEMQSWWHQQSIVNIYGSSILILYDAWELEYMFKTNELDLLKEPINTSSHLLTAETELHSTNEMEGSATQLNKTVEASTQTPNPVVPKLQKSDSFIDSFQLPWVRVYMIDFAHVVYPFSPTKDDNYIRGLNNLIKLIETL